MRISDWSSDVCSSDFLIVGDVGNGVDWQARKRPASDSRSDERHEQDEPATLDGKCDDAVYHDQCPCSASPFPSSALRLKLLGPASCSWPLSPDVTTTLSPFGLPSVTGVALKPWSVRTNTVDLPSTVCTALCGTSSDAGPLPASWIAAVTGSPTPHCPPRLSITPTPPPPHVVSFRLGETKSTRAAVRRSTARISI